MKALSIKQPWAHCILHEGKTVENRSWSTKYRGPILLHAGKRPDNGCRRIIEAQHGIIIPEDLPAGGIVGIANLVDVIQLDPRPGSNLNRRERQLLAAGWAEPGQYHWILQNIGELPFHPWKGQLGLFEIHPPLSMTTASYMNIRPKFLELRDHEYSALEAIEQIATVTHMEPWEIAQRLHGTISEPFIDMYFPEPVAA